jgi:endonuclease I/V8-like Glu-specific endopeptidase
MTMDPNHPFLKALSATEARYQKSRGTREAREGPLARGSILEANDRHDLAKRLERLKVDPGTVRAVVAGEASYRMTGPPPTAAGAGGITLERLLGSNDLMDVRFLEQGMRAARAVARVQVRAPSGRRIGFGTGFLVSPRLLLTNHHVLETKANAAPSLVEFNYERGPQGEVKGSQVLGLDPDSFFLADPELDYALVAIRAGAPVEPFGWLRLIEDQGKVVVGEWVNIIQHPNGEPKQLALRENRVINELEQFLHYHTDTAPGSSGSPVLNDQWELVALHHSGVPVRDAQGNILTRDNQIWDPAMGEHRIDWVANEGARISRVIAHIKGQPLDASGRALREALFGAEPPSPEGAGLPAKTPATSVTPTPPPTRSPLIAADGSVTWTIPLSVTIRLGHPIAPAATAGSVPGPVPPPAPPQAEQPAAPTPLDAETQGALEELAEARTRVYYDETADGAAAAAYYAHIDPEAAREDLFEQLSKLVSATHARTFPYQPRRHVYPWVDLHPDLMLRSIYSGEIFDPEELIREDFRIEEERAAAIRELVLREATVSTAQMEQELRLLEARLPFNCEHVVPQSWFQEKEPMRGDIHHLFACESGCNSFRGNLPYFDFEDFMEAERDRCGKRAGDDKFEPVAGKGTVARAALYFLLRYPRQIGNEADEMQRDRLGTLVTWHNAFPPGPYERHRNAAIAAMQGNRNPLIDHPEWGDRIAFDLGFG